MKKESTLRVAVFGAGYWAGFQIAAWQAIGVEVAAIWNRTKSRAEEAAARFGIPLVFDSPEELFERAEFDVADIITDAPGHEALVRLAASRRKPVICQKPMAGSAEACQRMVEACEKAGVWYAVHENFRYQPQLVGAKKLLSSGAVGKPVRAHLVLRSPDRAIMEKQPALKSMDHMALRDMGPHIFDVARFLFGEMKSIYSAPIVSCPDIGVVDGSLSLLETAGGMPLSCDLVHEFPYKLFAEGEEGTLLVGRDNTITVTRNGRAETHIERAAHPTDYFPADDRALHGDHVFASIPACLASLRDAFLAGREAETSGADNLKTMRLVFAAIASQDEKRPIVL